MSFAGYELIESLGSGNHGECFLARPPARLGFDGDVVALKVLAVSATPEACARVADELAHAAAVDSPHLIVPLEAGRVDWRVFYASPHVVGGSLARPASPPSRVQVLRAGADAARAAHALHDAGLAHRAIKPSNILLTDAGGALADVGLTHVVSPGQTIASFGSIDAIEFIEPAALLGEPAGRPSDIWSLAVALHRVLSGTSVYGAIPTDGMLSALRLVLETSPTLASELTEGEADLLGWCLEAERAARPGTAELVADRLVRLAEDVA